MDRSIIWNGSISQLLRSAPGYRYFNESVLPSNICEEQDALVLKMAVPGIKREQIEINMDEENCLEIQVKNPVEDRSENQVEDREEVQYLRREFDLQGDPLQRRFQFSNGLDLQAVEASLEDGILTVRIAKKASEKRSIAIA